MIAEPTTSPRIRKTTKAARKMKKSTLAIPAAAAEIPVKPNDGL